MGDREVWVSHLQGIGHFSKEVVEKLAIFGINGSPEMMSEVLKATASRMHFPRDMVMTVKVSIQGWGAPVNMDVAGHNLEELTGVAQTVGAKFILEEVECFWLDDRIRRILQKIISHAEDQKVMLAYTALSSLWMINPCELLVLGVSKRWKIRNLQNFPGRTLADFTTDIVASGQIEKFHIKKKEVDNLDALKRIWEISANVTIDEGGQEGFSTFGGGRGENPEAEWQRLLSFLGPSAEEDNNNNND